MRYRSRELRSLLESLVDEHRDLGHQATPGSGANETAVLTIDDAGPGVAAEQRDTVLKPFQRLETSRNRATGGSGLGLTIARTIIDKHRGDLELLEAPGGGLRLRVSLPAR